MELTKLLRLLRLELDMTVDPHRKKLIEEEIELTERKLEDQYARGRLLVEISQRIDEPKRPQISQTLLCMLRVLAVTNRRAASFFSQGAIFSDSELAGLINQCMRDEIGFDAVVMSPSILNWKKEKCISSQTSGLSQ